VIHTTFVYTNRGLKSYIAVGETSLSTPVSTELFNTKNNSLRNEELFTSELNTEYKGKYTLQGLQRTAVGPAPPKVGPDWNRISTIYILF
jgi:hypothetical protein